MSRCHSSPASPLDTEDLLREILIRLPPQPSQLPRVSAVCKRWHHILSEPQFLCQFRKHHRNPLLLGFFDTGGYGRAPVFSSLMELKPDHIPAVRFAMPEDLVDWDWWGPVFFGCRHGLALLLNFKSRETVVWDPLTGVHHRVAFPPRFKKGKRNKVRSAAVLCSTINDRHVHDGCCLSSFKLVLVCHDAKPTNASTCIYDSKSGIWGDIISTTNTDVISTKRPSILVGNALCWLLFGGNILEFDLGRQTLVVIKKPSDAHDIGSQYADWSFQILREGDNGLRLAVLSISKLSIQFWVKRSNYDGVIPWVLQRTVQLNELISQPPHTKALFRMTGYDEDTNVIFVTSGYHDIMLELESMKSRYIGRREHNSNKVYYPYTNFYVLT